MEIYWLNLLTGSINRLSFFVITKQQAAKKLYDYSTGLEFVDSMPSLLFFICKES